MKTANPNPRRSPDLSELDDDAFERFMAELLSDLALQRRTQGWRLPRLMPMQPVAA